MFSIAFAVVFYLVHAYIRVTCGSEYGSTGAEYGSTGDHEDSPTDVELTRIITDPEFDSEFFQDPGDDIGAPPGTPREQVAFFQVPHVGLGTWFQDTPTSQRETSNNLMVQNAIESAVNVGYRLFDLADNYKSSSVVRDELKKQMLLNPIIKYYIITKTDSLNITSSMIKYKNDLVDKSHPFPHNLKFIPTIHFAGTLTDEQLFNTWKEMNNLLVSSDDPLLSDNNNEGLNIHVEFIGVSNLYINQMKKLIEFCEKEHLQKPHFNEIEISPMVAEYEYIEYMELNNIIPIAYSPLRIIGNEHYQNYLKRVFENVRIKLSTDLGETISLSRLILSWLQHRGVIVIPCSKDITRQNENLKTILIPTELMQEIDLEIKKDENIFPLIEEAFESKQRDMTL